MRVKLSGIVLHLLRWLHDPEGGPRWVYWIKLSFLVSAAALKPLRSGSGNQLEPPKYNKSEIPSGGS